MPAAASGFLVCQKKQYTQLAEDRVIVCIFTSFVTLRKRALYATMHIRVKLEEANKSITGQHPERRRWV
ncbi:hypothetical protein AR543_19340 [Paenibacillus bovis]|uniref:Uncharacterized protein n=1 Tax=Paenibacillus bovis TaxID=1616788 RepID=A0A172ZJY9_9BACL|nr:hypothetical protein AR543_19340 [Paenibacillus bovis]